MNHPTSALCSATACLQRLQKEQLIGIVRTSSAESALWASQILIESGFQCIEIPYTVPEATQVIETLARQFPQASIGAGTVLEAKHAIQALGAGAQFLVSPVLLPPLIQLGKEQDILILPGCMTPSEIYQAHELGAQAVKLFPAEPIGGAGFIQALRGPFPHIPIVATGGIQLEHVATYLQAGATAVGVGGPLIPKAWVESKNSESIQQRAKQYLAQRTAQA